MTKDYAKRKNTNYKAKRKSSPSSPTWSDDSTSVLSPLLWLTLGLVLGLLIASGVFWKLQDASFLNKTDTLVKTNNTSAPVKEIETKNEPSREIGPRFDFYTLLPNMNVEVQDLSNKTSSLNTPEAKTPSKKSQLISTPTSKSETKPNEAFIIQVASFRSHQQAESLKASLALSGYETNIQPITIGANDTWYRLYLGPYPDRNSAENAQAKLESEQKMNSLVMKINV